MKKAKLLMALSSLSLVSTSIPVVSTSCSTEFNFDGEYSEADVLCTNLYNNDWINTNFKYEGQDWSTPSNPNMDTDYGDTAALTYFKDNLKTVKQYVACLIYSIMLAFHEINGEGHPTIKIKIEDSDFVYDNRTKLFTLFFTLLYYDYEQNKYVPYYKVRTTQGKQLQVLRVCKYNNDLVSIAVGSSYNDKQFFLDFGLEISFYGSNGFTEWQDVNALNTTTRNYIDGLAIYYIPSSIIPSNAKFKENNIEIWIFENLDELNYKKTGEDIEIKRGDIDKELYLYALVIDVNGFATLMSGANLKASVSPADCAVVNAHSVMLGIYPTNASAWVGAEVKLSISVEFALGVITEAVFNLVLVD